MSYRGLQSLLLTGLAVLFLLGASPIPAQAQAIPRGDYTVQEMVTLLTRARSVGSKGSKSVKIDQRPEPPPSLPLLIHFEFGKARLTDDGMRVANTLASAIQKIPEDRFEIEGHTDAVGSDAYNDALSWERAIAVVNYLQSCCGIPASRLKPLGFGKRQLIPGIDKDSELNRRVQITNYGPMQR